MRTLFAALFLLSGCSTQTWDDRVKEILAENRENNYTYTSAIENRKIQSIAREINRGEVCRRR